jgi:hypothetical protein
MGSGGAQHASVFAADLEFWHQGFDKGAAKVFRNARLVTLLSRIAGISLLIGMDLLAGATTCLRPDGRWSMTFAE